MKDNKKINKTRRNRGYAFENSIVKKFNSKDNWNSVRLGSPSINIPDVFCVNDWYRTLIAIEAKSVISELSYIPQDQIERCRRWVDYFGIYNNRIVVLAFKFGRTKNKKLKIFYKIFPKSAKPSQVRCRYSGKTSIKKDDKWIPIVMEDFKWQ